MGSTEHNLGPEGAIVVKVSPKKPTSYPLMAPLYLVTVPPVGVPVFTHMSLWGAFSLQTILLAVFDFI